ncbi:MAG: hypothetical protein IPM54_06440 [Polyangiaceae bacterium]|nr:hypothetical protein [Polyangiaceae bacterium]
MKNRFILCQADRHFLGDLPLSMWINLLARAISSHLEDWAVVVEPMVSATLYRPDQEPSSLVHFHRMDALVAEVAARLPASRNVRATQFLTLRPADDATLVEFVGGDPQFFHGVSPLLPYSDRFAASPATMISWLRPKEGRIMPAILLPPEPSGHAGAISFYHIADGWSAPDPPERDACRMRVNTEAIPIAHAESNWMNVDRRVRMSFERWARTVTKRRVGVSISGGGAAVMRLVPLFRALEMAGVPIDLLSGASGSTAFSACYATGGLPRVLALAERGLSILITATLTSVITSSVVQRYIDNFLEGCGVCNTEIRVVPMAMTLPPNAAPRPSVVVDGTFGQAARASGGIPMIGPYAVDGTRHFDGSVIAGLPPPNVLRQFGADIVFAMNVLAVPASRFPGENSAMLSKPLGFFYHQSLLGRIADTISAASILVHTIAEGHGRTADVFIDAPPRNWAIFEPPMLFNSRKYATIGLGAGIDPDTVAAECLSRWQALA